MILLILTGLAWSQTQWASNQDPATTLSPQLSADQNPTAPAFSPKSSSSSSSSGAQPAHPLGTSQPREYKSWVIFSLADSGYAHIFAYQPSNTTFTRLTNQPWDDIAPALSPDGAYLAFSSHANHFWEIYLLDFSTGSISQLTRTSDFDSNPSWSPDGLWLAYETYRNHQWDIFIQSVHDRSQAPDALTGGPFNDFSPTWSPQGSKIAFISDRDGEDAVWIASLANGENRFEKIPQPAHSAPQHPTWSPDGSKLAWSIHKDGEATIVVWDSVQPVNQPKSVTNGDWPCWSPDGKVILSLIANPDLISLANDQIITGQQELRLVSPPGSLEGLDWGLAFVPDPLPAPLLSASQATAEPLITPVLTPMIEGPANRVGIVALQSVNAPYAYLSDLADDSFHAFRTRVSIEIGWDFLANLENAYVPLTTPLDPGLNQDWLYTGRSIAINRVSMNAGWMALAREDIGSDTYWRVYLKTRAQDGSQGRPIHSSAWEFPSRPDEDPTAIAQGGSQSAEKMQGYWVDFTEIARRYGWTRFPALPDWRSFYPGNRANEFALTAGLDWESAMLELYPPEIFSTKK